MNNMNENERRQVFRQVWHDNKANFKAIKKQIKFASPAHYRYARFSSSLRKGKISKAAELLANWKHEPTKHDATSLYLKFKFENDKILYAENQAKEQQAKETQRKIDLAMAKTQAAEDAIKAREKAQADIDKFEPKTTIKEIVDYQIPTSTIDPELIDDVKYMASQTHHGFEHVERWNRVLAAFGIIKHANPTTTQEALDNTKKYSSPLWPKIANVLNRLDKEKEVKETGKRPTLKEKMDKTKESFEKLEATVAANVANSDVGKHKKIVDVADQVILRKEKEDERADLDELKEIPKSEWGNIFNDLQRKWAIEYEEPAIAFEFHAFYKNTLDEHFLTEEEFNQVASNKNYAQSNLDSMSVEEQKIQKEYIADLEIVQQIYHQKLDTQPAQPPKDPYEHLQGRRRWNKMLWDIQKNAGYPDSKTISNLRGKMFEVWNLQTSDHVIKNIQREDILEKVIAIVNEKIQADSGIASIAASNTLQRKIAQECFVEQFGDDLHIANGSPRSDCCPQWLLDAWPKLRTWCMAKGGSYWSSISQNIYNSLNGQNVRDVWFDSVPYGTMRMVSPYNTTYQGIRSIEYEPDKEKCKAIIAWRRNQISLYLNGLIKREEINWRMPDD